MDLLHEWIGKTIEQELGQALLWRDDDANSSLIAGKVGDLVIEDDGSNLRVKSPKPRIVQLIKFVTFEEPLQATVSDGVTRVNVKFSAAASQRYTQKTRRSLTDGTPGGLIQLLDFKITATHLGPRPSRLTIFVEDFKSIGSNGSGHYGLATPHGIESRVAVKMHIEKLTTIRKAESPSGHASPTPSIRSQLSNSSSIDDAPSTTQVMFATQAPPPDVPAARISKPDDLNISTNTYPERPAPGPSPAIGIPSVSRPPITDGKTGLMTSSEALLKLLNNTKCSPQSTPHTNCLAVVPGIVSNHDKAPTNSEARSTELHTPPPNSSTSLSEQPLVETAVNEKASNPSVPVGNRYSTQSMSAQLLEQHPTRKRISSREVKIPRDQGNLLDSDSAWLPAQPGHREPVANIPISILESLNRDADVRALQNISLKRKRTMDSPFKAAVTPRRPSHCTATDGTQESDSDVPVSSGQWPPTPDHNQLPPDSSPASAKISDHSVTAEKLPLARSKSINTTSIPSKSTPVPSAPQTPISSLGSPRNLSIPSSGVVSNFASEDEVFICQAIGCEKAYKNVPALKYHIELRHNDKILTESHKCNLKDCDRSYPTSGALSHHIRQVHGDGKFETCDSQYNASKNISSQTSTPLHLTVQVAQIQPNDVNANTMEGRPSNECRSETPRKLSPPVYKKAVSPDSELELMVPKALSISRESYPSTASQPGLPFTQVKQTPYIDVHGKGRDPQISLPTSNGHNQPTGSLPHSTSHVTSSAPSTSDKIDRIATDSLDLDADSRVDERENSPKATQVGRSEQFIGDQNQNVPGQHGIAADNVDYTAPQPQNAALKVLRDFPGTRSTIIDTSRTITDGKRKRSDSNLLPSGILHRRKMPKFPATLDFAEELEHRRDPSEGARQIRQEFLASRRGSESSTPVQSPTLNLTGRANSSFTTTEKPMANIEMMNADTSTSEELNVADNPSQQTGSNFGMVVSATRQTSTTNMEMGKPTTREPQQLNVDARHSPPVVQDLSTNIVFNDEDTKAGAQDQERIAQVFRNTIGEVTSMNHIDLTRDVSPLHDYARADFRGSSIPQSSEDDTSEQEPIARDQLFMKQDKASPVRALRYPIGLQADIVPLQLVTAEFPSKSSSTRSETASSISIITSNDQVECRPLASRVLSVDVQMPETGKSIRPLALEPATEVGESSSVPPNLFDNFKTAYPSYPGDIHSFVAICRKISDLEKTNQMEHQSLWDDFIIRHEVEYVEYLQSQAKITGNTLPFEEFYRTEIEAPLYNNRLVTRRNLQEVLSLIPTALHMSRQDAKGERHGKTQLGDGVGAQLGQSKVSANLVKPSEQAPVIDLTGEKRRARHANLIEKALRGSPTSKKPASRRSLPWSDHISPSKIGDTQCSPSPKHHSRLKDFIDTPGGSRSKVYKPTPQIIDERYDRPELYEASMKSARGVRALGPQISNNTDRRQLHLIKDIVENVDLPEERRLIEKKIHPHSKRISGEGAPPTLTEADLKAVSEAALRRKATPAGSQGRRLQAGDKSSMATSTPLCVPQANAAEVPRDTSVLNEWWRDDETPFKSFARAYASLRHGRGNSYAEPAHRDQKVGEGREDGRGKGRVRSGSGKGEGDMGKQLKQVDILGWKL